jgi:fused signal recognition particle receptor
MEKQGLFGRLRAGLSKTRDALAGRIDELFAYYREIDDDFFEELTDLLIASDMGARAAGGMVERLRERVRREKTGRIEEIHALLRGQLAASLRDPGAFARPFPA